MAPKAAFITGGNGITGCALLEHLTKTDATEWSKIIVTSRSPFKTVVDDDRVTFIALDFTLDPARLIESMQPVCADVTHAYFSSYVHRDDFQELNKANVDLFDNFLQSLLALTSKLACCLFQTGEPRRESPIGNFYFLVCRELGAEAKMPTNQSYWEGYDGVSDARLIADISIWASTEPHAGNQAINVANGDYFSWRHMWPRPAAYFGAKASSDQVFTQPRPKEGERHQEFRLVDWDVDKEEIWARVCNRSSVAGAKGTWSAGTWCATLSVNKARQFGWSGHLDSYKSFTDTFKSFIELGLIPKP